MWDKYKNIDAKKLNEEVNELKDGDFPEIPNGRYEVSLDSLELKPTKEKGYPMVAAQFTILEGQYKKQKIFMNQVLLMDDQNDKYRLKTCNAFLNSLGTNVNVVFEGVREYAEMVSRIFDLVDENRLEYLLQISDSKPSKDGRTFKQYDIVDIYS